MRKSFYLHRRGRVWYVELRDPVTGKINTPKSTKQTNRSAAEKVALMEAARLAELSDFPPMSFGEWGDRFFIDKCPHVTRLRLEGKRISDRYVKNCRMLWLNNIKVDKVCGVQLASLRRAHCLAFRDRLVARVGRTRTAQTSWAVFRLIAREAFFHGLTDRDPCVGIGQISYAKKTRVVLSKEQVISILGSAKWEGSLYYEPTLCAALTGMRRGEVRGLLWSDLDPKAGLIYVNHNLPGSAGAGDDTDPKWGKKRVTVYPAKLQALLEPRRGEGYVFQVRKKPVGGERWLKKFKEIADEAGAPGATLHSLRHTIHNLLLQSGIEKELLRGSFGWSGEDVQGGYTHADIFDYSPQSSAVDKIFKDGENGHI